MSVPGTIFQPNSSTDFSTGITYVGPSSSGLVLQNQYTMQTDEYGASTLRRSWKIPRNQTIANYLPQKGNLDFQYTTLQVFDYSVEGDGPYETLTVNYNGFLSRPQKPIVRETLGRQIREHVIYGIRGGAVDATLGSLTIVYIAPTRTRRWASIGPVNLKDSYLVTDFYEPIKFVMFKSPSGVEVSGTTISFLSRFFPYGVRPVRVDLQSDHEGNVYRNTEVCEMQIVQTEHDNINVSAVV